MRSTRREPPPISEFRQDPVTGDWVLVAAGRMLRPHAFRGAGRLEGAQPKRGCPFERIRPEVILAYDRAGRRLPLESAARSRSQRRWWVQVAANKYPALGPGQCRVRRSRQPFQFQDGVGFHEIVVTRDHDRPIARMQVGEVQTVLGAYRDRYRELARERCVAYISVFHNDGRAAGASLSHPHSQIITLPVVPTDIGRSLKGSAEYFRRHRRCVHCAMLRTEVRDRRRVIASNRSFVALCPFVSRQAFEIRVFPRRHRPRFEESDDGALKACAQVLSVAMAKLDRALDRPAYNFFIHTSPVAGAAAFGHYHWHIEIIPKTAVWAGFEIGTGIEISSTAPEDAASRLRRASP